MSNVTPRAVEDGPMHAQVTSDDGVTGARVRKEAQRLKDANPVRVRRVEDKQVEVKVEESEGGSDDKGVLGFLKGWNGED